MRQFITICQTELCLFVREFSGFFFTLIFPVMLLLLFGGIYGNSPVYEGSDVGMVDLSVPAYCIMVTGVTGLMSLPLTLSGYKEKKVYKRFDATPAGKKSILTAQVLIQLIMTFIGTAILLITGKLIYQIQISGTFLPIFTGLLISTASMFSMGFLFTAIGQDIKGTSLLCYLFYFVMLFLSGATIPDMLFPDPMKKISAFLPMTYAVDLMQGVFAGESLILYKKELLLLVLLTLVCSAAGAILYRKKDWT